MANLIGDLLAALIRIMFARNLESHSSPTNSNPKNSNPTSNVPTFEFTILRGRNFEDKKPRKLHNLPRIKESFNSVKFRDDHFKTASGEIVTVYRTLKLPYRLSAN